MPPQYIKQSPRQGPGSGSVRGRGDRCMRACQPSRGNFDMEPFRGKVMTTEGEVRRRHSFEEGR